MNDEPTKPPMAWDAKEVRAAMERHTEAAEKEFDAMRPPKRRKSSYDGFLAIHHVAASFRWAKKHSETKEAFLAKLAEIRYENIRPTDVRNMDEYEAAKERFIRELVAEYG